MEQETSPTKEDSIKTNNDGAKNQQTPSQQATSQPSAKKKKRGSRSKTLKPSRSRSPRPYPASSFQEALPLAEAIHQYAASQKVRRLTLLQQIQKSPTSSATQMLITNSSKYGITTGSYAAEWLELTPEGAIATALGPLTAPKIAAQFRLAINSIKPFSILYDEYKGERLPSREVMKDILAEQHIATDTAVCQWHVP